MEAVCREGPAAVLELAQLGAEFTCNKDGSLHLTREGGHSNRRIVHAADVTGREIERALLAAAQVGCVHICGRAVPASDSPSVKLQHSVTGAIICGFRVQCDFCMFSMLCLCYQHDDYTHVLEVSPEQRCCCRHYVHPCILDRADSSVYSSYHAGQPKHPVP